MLHFLLRGAAIKELRNRKGHFFSIAALLLRRPAVENGALLLRRELKERRNIRAIAAAATRQTSRGTSQNLAAIRVLLYDLEKTINNVEVFKKVTTHEICVYHL